MSASAVSSGVYAIPLAEGLRNLTYGVPASLLIISRNMNAHFQPESISLDQLQIGLRASIASIDWDTLEDGEAARLRHFGFDEGVTVEPLHLGPFGRDPLAIRVGRMTVAIRRSHARAVRVVPAA